MELNQMTEFVYLQIKYKSICLSLRHFKSGACWVPLSASFPSARIKYLIKVLKPKFIISENEYYDNYSNIYEAFNSKF